MIRARAGDGQPDPTLAEFREALTRGLDLRAEYDAIDAVVRPM
jgi:hypothetical protein